MTLFLIRHCQSTGHLPGADLTEAGHRAARALADRLIAFRPDAIYSSPFMRALATVTPLANRLNIEVAIDERLRERLNSTAPIDDKDIQLHFERSFADPDYRAVGGESLNDAASRGLAALADVRGRGHRCAVVSGHGNLISSILRRIDRGFGYAEFRRMTNPDVFEIEFEGDRPVAFRGERNS